MLARSLVLRLMQLAVTLLMLPAGAHAQVIFSEDFESPDTPNYLTVFAGNYLVTASNNWAVTANSVDLYEAAARPEAGAYDGAQALDLTGSPDAGVMETTFATLPGAVYELTFHYARNNYLGAEIGDAQVDVIGTTLLLQALIQHDPISYAFDDYQQFQSNFTADSTETLLRFTSFEDGIAGITIDGISIALLDATGFDGPRAQGAGDGFLRASPNPFVPAVGIEYVTTVPGHVDMRIHDARGRLVRTLVREVQAPGRHTATWNGTTADGTRAAPGVYLCVLATSLGKSTQRVTLLR